MLTALLFAKRISMGPTISHVFVSSSASSTSRCSTCSNPNGIFTCSGITSMYAPESTKELTFILLFTLNVFNLLLSSTPRRLCPFTPVTTDAIMSNADDFQDRPVRAGRLSPSPPTRTSVFPYTSLLGNCSQDVYGRTSVPACHHNVRRGRLTYHALVIWITPFPFVT